MSTLKVDALTTKSDNADLTITGGGTGVPNLETGYKVNGTVEKLTGIAPSTSGNVLTSDGTDWTSAAAGGGAFLQVIEGLSTTQVTTSSTSYVDTTLTAVITLSSTSSKVLITVCLTASADGGDQTKCHMRVLRGVTDVTGDVVLISDFSGGRNELSASYSRIDSPSSTSSLTYKLQVKTSYSGSILHAIASGTAVIILQEIAP